MIRTVRASAKSTMSATTPTMINGVNSGSFYS
jgi:hypothetical protein